MTPAARSKPDPFLRVMVTAHDLEPTLTAMCAGFEQSEWRAEQFATHLFEWLPEFALSWTERQSFTDATAVELLRRAARVVYATEKYRKRGEFGELILHVIIRQVFNSEPAISKIFYKDSANDTVKGFDAVHVVPRDEALELWLGEAKFYGDVTDALAAVAAELVQHMERDYLRSEFAAITNKIDESWPYAERLKKLLSPNTSLDEVFDVVRIPVLITYDSEVVAAHAAHTDEYAVQFKEEVEIVRSRFAKKALPEVQIHLCLVPLKSKEVLLSHLHEKLRSWQTL